MMLKVAFFVLAIAASLAAAQNVFAVEGKCEDLFCKTMSLNLMYAKAGDPLPPKKLDVQIVPTQPQPDAFKLVRYSAIDTNKNLMYFIAATRDVVPLMNIYTVDLNSPFAVTANASLDTTVYHNISSIEVDSNGQVWGFFQNIACTIDPNTGAVKKVMELWDAQTSHYYTVPRISAIDLDTDRIFFPVLEEQSDRYYVATFNVATQTVSLSQTYVGWAHLYQAFPQAYTWNKNMGKLMILTESLEGPTVEGVDPVTGQWSDIMPADQFYDNYGFDIPLLSQSFGRQAAANYDATNDLWYMQVIVVSSGADQTVELTAFSPVKKSFYETRGSSADMTDIMITL